MQSGDSGNSPIQTRTLGRIIPAFSPPTFRLFPTATPPPSDYSGLVPGNRRFAGFTFTGDSGAHSAGVVRPPLLSVDQARQQCVVSGQSIVLHERTLREIHHYGGMQ